jgi:hypothetical protein
MPLWRQTNTGGLFRGWADIDGGYLPPWFGDNLASICPRGPTKTIVSRRGWLLDGELIVGLDDLLTSDQLGICAGIFWVPWVFNTGSGDFIIGSAHVTVISGLLLNTGCRFFVVSKLFDISATPTSIWCPLIVHCVKRIVTQCPSASPETTNSWCWNTRLQKIMRTILVC